MMEPVDDMDPTAKRIKVRIDMVKTDGMGFTAISIRDKQVVMDRTEVPTAL